MKGKIKKVIINLILISIIFTVFFWVGVQEASDRSIPEKTSQEESNTVEEIFVINAPKKEEQMPEPPKEYPKEEVLKTYKGYAVGAKLEIPKISLQTYILKENSKKALDVSVTKFFGPEPNHSGNLCIAGHNAPNKNMFRKIKNLEKGDKLYVIDNTIGRVEYEVYDVYKVDPIEVGCLSQTTNQQKEVTLITCTSDSKQRTIVKARETK